MGRENIRGRGPEVQSLHTESKPAMNKRQLIDDIRRYNETAQPQFLAQFDEEALKQYLEHLEGAARKRVQIASWVRKTPKMRMVS